MLLQQLNRSDAEKIFIICRNTSGATLAANLPVYFETDAVSDGVAISQMTADVSGTGTNLFAGINDASLADDAYGLVQVYGHRTSAVVQAVDSSYDLAVGGRCVGVAGAAYLAFGTGLAAGPTTELLLSPLMDRYVISMETIAAAASGSTTTTNAKVFIRALS